MFKTFVFGIVLGVVGAGAVAWSVPAVDLHREVSLISVQSNGGNTETFRIDLPRDRIMVGLAGVDNALPAELEWPGEHLLGNLQAEMFKVRDRNGVVIGVASRLATATEETGPFIEWAVHLPARGTIFLQMDLEAAAEGYRSGTLKAGTRDFETLRGSVREQFITDVGDGEGELDGRIELITSFIGQWEDEL